VSDVVIWIALMTDSTRDSIMKINPIVHTRKDTGNFFQLRNEKKNVLPISEFWFQFTGFDMLLLFTTFSISLLEGWSYQYTTCTLLSLC
jgi:hypothetical protein